MMVVLFTRADRARVPARRHRHRPGRVPDKAERLACVEVDGKAVGSELHRPGVRRRGRRSRSPEYFQSRPVGRDDRTRDSRLRPESLEPRARTSGPTNPDSREGGRRSGSTAYRELNGLGPTTPRSRSTRSPPRPPGSTRTSRSRTPASRRARVAEERGLPVRQVLDARRRAHRRPLARLPRREAGERPRAQPRARPSSRRSVSS